MEKSSPPTTSAPSPALDEALAAAMSARRGRLADLDVPTRSYDVDTLLVELGPAEGDDAPPVDISRTV